MRLSHRITLLLAMLLVAVSAGHASEWTFTGVNRVVAISDIHGDYDAMVRTLQSAAILDREARWSGANAHLVVIGDILDRGPDSRQVMDLLMRLENEAATAGGRVHLLIGNHEAMNLTGDLRYVSGQEFAAFAAEETADERQRWFEAWAAKRASTESTAAARQATFDERFPPGFFAHRRAFAPDGRYGRWLMAKPILIVIDGTAYVHGGLSPMIGEIGLSGVNDRLRGELNTYVELVTALVDEGLLLPTDSFYDHQQRLRGMSALLTADDELAAVVKQVIRLHDSDVHAVDGPLWYRGNVACTAVIESGKLDKALAAIGANRVVIGHTPTPGHRIVERLGGRVIEIDTGMLNAYYKGHGSALVIGGGALAVVNENGGQLSAPAQHPRGAGQQDAGLDTRRIEKLLANGDVVADRKGSQGQRVLTLSDGKNTVHALFVRRESRGFFPNVAAYRLDRMIGLDMVPVAVRRDVDNREGSVQFIPPETIDEITRRESGRGFAAMCPLPEQWDAMMVFDALIHNEARIATTIRYDESTWQMILIDYSRSFDSSKKRPDYLAAVELHAGDGWKTALASLSDEELEVRLSDVLKSKHIRALGARRDSLLAGEL